MAWTTPETRAAGDVLSAAKWNEQVRDNEIYLFSGRPKFSILWDNGADYSTSSTSFVDIDATNLTATITVSGSAVLLGFSGVKAGATADFDFSVDGVRVGAAGADGLMAAIPNIGTTLDVGVSLIALKSGLSVGSHTFRIMWKSPSGSAATLYAGAGSAGTDYIPHFWGIEVA